MAYARLVSNSPFVTDENGEIVGIMSPNGKLRLFLLALPEAVDPLDGVKAALTTDMTNANADITLTAVEYGGYGNDITVTYVDPQAATQALAVSVVGKDITVSLATDGGGTITSTCALVVAAINANADAAALVVATGEGSKAGVVNAMTVDVLVGGIDVTGGPIGCIAFGSTSEVMYRKATAQTWLPIAAHNLADLTDVEIATVANAEVLTYVDADGTWQNAEIPA